MGTGTRNVLIISATVMFCMVSATAITIEQITHDSGATIGIVTLLISFYGVALASIANLIKGEAIKKNTEEAVLNTHRILNGEMEQKIEKVVSDVLAKWLTDEASRPGKSP